MCFSLVMSQLFHLGEKMTEQASSKDEVDALISQLREEKDKVSAREKEIIALKLKVNNQEEDGILRYISTQYKAIVKAIRTNNVPELNFTQLVKDLGMKHYFHGLIHLNKTRSLRENINIFLMLHVLSFSNPMFICYIGRIVFLWLHFLSIVLFLLY